MKYASDREANIKSNFQPGSMEFQSEVRKYGPLTICIKWKLGKFILGHVEWPDLCNQTRELFYVLQPRKIRSEKINLISTHI